MARVLVTGGTGMLGRRLVPMLVSRGHAVRSMSRHATTAVDGAEAVRGDVRTGDALQEATRDVDVVIHAATSPFRHVRETEVAGTRNVATAIRDSGAHLIYVSIVGVDRIRFPYYRAKWETERLVESSASAWTIQRATQFHDLLDQFLGRPIFMRTPNLAFQPVDADEVAARLADLVDAGPSGRSPDFGGPEVLSISELAAIRRDVMGAAARLVRLPRLGPLRDFDNGHHRCPDHRAGRRTWRQWLEAAADDSM